MTTEHLKGQELKIDQYRISQEPFYLPVGNEVELFRTAHHNRMPVMLKGPTGCGKTRFVQHMAYQLKRPLITIACHEDLTASDIVGRYLLRGDETVWTDGPLTLAAKHGAICYLDEVVEARKDTTVVIHPLTDERRILPLEKKGQIIEAVDEFMLVISYNPGYQSVLKELKQSTRQRFLGVEFGYPSRDSEIRIIQHETGLQEEAAGNLVKLGEKIRNLRNHGLEEGVSTRLLVYTGQLIRKGIPPRAACESAIVQPITDDPDMHQSMKEIVATIYP
ncbi:MAG TPA: CbbQ/NirQ/NorQ/GpvN family protein [Nitrospiria bacterium]